MWTRPRSQRRPELEITQPVWRVFSALLQGVLCIIIKVKAFIWLKHRMFWHLGALCHLLSTHICIHNTNAFWLPTTMSRVRRADSEDRRSSILHKQASKHSSVTWDIKLWSAARHSSLWLTWQQLFSFFLDLPRGQSLCARFSALNCDPFGRFIALGWKREMCWTLAVPTIRFVFSLN